MCLKIKVLFLSLCILLSINLIAQNKHDLVHLSGVVIDAQTNQALVGASIRVYNTTIGTVADKNGKFSLNVPRNSVLLVNFIGMLPYRFKVKTSRNFTIRLKPDYNALNQTVVTGYRQEKTKLFVGSASRISPKRFVEAPYADFTRLLESKAPGLNISNVSSSFGAAPKINIRGGASINGSVQPLWVVDGIILDDIVPINTEQLVSGDPITLLGSSVAGLNPSDIQSIEVLKDATATSLYGAKGMNGVIVITTKTAKRNSGFKIHYDFVTSYRFTPSYSDYDRLNSEETMELYRLMENKGFFNMESALYGRRGGIYTQMYEAIKRGELANTQEAKDRFLAQAASRNTNWFDLLYRRDLSQRHSVSLSYGGKKATNYISLSIFNDPGQTIADKVKRFTFNLNNKYYLSSKLQLGLMAQASYRNQDAPGTFDRVQNLEEGSYQRDFDINPFLYALNTPRVLSPYNADHSYSYYRNEWANFNILNEYKNNKLNISLSDVSLNFSANYQPIKDLKLFAIVNFRRLNSVMQHRIGENSNVIGSMRANQNFYVNENNLYLYRSSSSTMAQVPLPKGGILTETKRSLQSYLARLSADYNRSFGKNAIRAFAFFEMKASDYVTDNFTGYGIDFQRSNSIATSPLIFEKTLAEGKNYFSLMSLHERIMTLSTSLNYSYDSKYILNLVANIEGSNAAGTGKTAKYLPTWNLGVKWNIDRESFFSALSPIFSALDLRASYGLAAKMNEAAISSSAVYNSSYAFRRKYSDRADIIRLSHLENRDLTWEKMYEANIGLDMAFFDGRVTTTLDLYSRHSFDLIDYIHTSGIGGESLKLANFGNMRTMGVDLSVNTLNLKTDKFEWSSVFAFSTYYQAITSLEADPTTFDLVSGNGRGNVVGYPRSSMYSFYNTGLNSWGLPVFYLGDLPNNFPNKGLYSVAGANFSDARYNFSYLDYNGPLEPNTMLGINNSFKYGNWTFSFFISGKFGNVIRLHPSFDPAYKDLNVFDKSYKALWFNNYVKFYSRPTIAGKDLSDLYGRNNIERAYNTYNYSSKNVVDASFIRLNSITIAYQIPSKYIKAFNIERANLALQFQNLFLLYSSPSLRGQDPEYINVGGVGAPVPKSVSFSLNVNF